MELTPDQLKVKAAWQDREIERLTTENTRLRSAITDRLIATGEMTLEAEDDA